MRAGLCNSFSCRGVADHREDPQGGVSWHGEGCQTEMGCLARVIVMAGRRQEHRVVVETERRDEELRVGGWK